MGQAGIVSCLGFLHIALYLFCMPCNQLYLCGFITSVLLMSFHSLPSVAFAQVDWHDFVVVETVDFKDSETGWHFFFQQLDWV